MIRYFTFSLEDAQPGKGKSGQNRSWYESYDDRNNHLQTSLVSSSLLSLLTLSLLLSELLACYLYVNCYHTLYGVYDTILSKVAVLSVLSLLSLHHLCALAFTSCTPSMPTGSSRPLTARPSPTSNFILQFFTFYLIILYSRENANYHYHYHHYHHHHHHSPPSFFPE